MNLYNTSIMADINNIIKQSIQETQHRAKKMMSYDFKVIDGELRNEIHSQLNRQEAIECFDRVLDELNNNDALLQIDDDKLFHDDLISGLTDNYDFVKGVRIYDIRQMTIVSEFAKNNEEFFEVFVGMYNTVTKVIFVKSEYMEDVADMFKECGIKVNNYE